MVVGDDNHTGAVLVGDLAKQLHHSEFIGRNEPQHGAARHRHIARITLARDHQTIKGTEKLGVRQPFAMVSQVHLRRDRMFLCFHNGGLGSRHIRAGDGQAFGRLIEIGLAGDLVGHQLLCALMIDRGFIIR